MVVSLPTTWASCRAEPDGRAGERTWSASGARALAALVVAFRRTRSRPLVFAVAGHGWYRAAQGMRAEGMHEFSVADDDNASSHEH